jgi:hypothetical protein
VVNRFEKDSDAELRGRITSFGPRDGLFEDVLDELMRRSREAGVRECLDALQLKSDDNKRYAKLVEGRTGGESSWRRYWLESEDCIRLIQNLLTNKGVEK